MRRQISLFVLIKQCVVHFNYEKTNFVFPNHIRWKEIRRSHQYYKDIDILFNSSFQYACFFFFFFFFFFFLRGINRHQYEITEATLINGKQKQNKNVNAFSSQYNVELFNASK